MTSQRAADLQEARYCLRRAREWRVAGERSHAATWLRFAATWRLMASE